LNPELNFIVIDGHNVTVKKSLPNGADDWLGRIDATKSEIGNAEIILAVITTGGGEVYIQGMLQRIPFTLNGTEVSVTESDTFH
jgi:hypothetical protein